MEIVNCSHGLKPIGTKDILLTLCVSSLECASLSYLYSDEELNEIIKEREDTLVKQGFNVKSEVIFGSAHKELNEIAQERNYSAIVVMGNKGRGYVEEFFMGSVCHYATRLSNTNTLLVPLTNQE
jgi:nucleotide-binding universal stress UspA family protein